MNYERDMEIDPSALDVEWMEQPKLMMTYSKNAAEAKKHVDLASEHLKVIEAELDKEIRTNPESFGIGKVTETGIKSTLILQATYQEANRELIEAQYEYEMAKSATFAISARKEALENLVRLFALQYFAGPTLPRDLNKEWDDHLKQQSSDSKVRLQRKPRGEAR
jgi:hypothetical protein